MFDARTLVTLAALGVVWLSPAFAQDPGNDDTGGPIEPAALALALDAAELLAQAKHVSSDAELSWDVLQEDGRLLEFGATRRVALRRPDKLRIDSVSRDGERGSLLFDGERIALFDADEGVYAVVERSGTLDDALDFVIEDLQTPIALSDLLASDLVEILREHVQIADWVGDEVLQGTPCHHISLRGDKTDMQLWIEKDGPPRFRRIAITFRHEEGMPQFDARFTSWDFETPPSDANFRFAPPKDAERIPFAIRKRTEEGAK